MKEDIVEREVKETEITKKKKRSGTVRDVVLMVVGIICFDIGEGESHWIWQDGDETSYALREVLAGECSGDR